MLEPLTLSTSSAPASTAARISPGSKRIHADSHAGGHQLAYDVAERGECETRRAADVDDVGARLAVALGLASNGVAREPRRVVDLGDDLDVPRAVLARLGGPPEMARDLAQVLGSLLDAHADVVRHGPGVALAQPRDHHQVGARRHGQRTRDPGRGHQCRDGDLQHRHVIVRTAAPSRRAHGAARARPACR